MKEITYRVWADKHRRLMDFARREITSVKLCDEVQRRVLDEVREPLKNADIVVIAESGTSLVGYACGIYLEEGITITSIVVSTTVDRLDVAPKLIFAVVNQLSRTGVFSYVQLEVPCVGTDYISASLKPHGFMVFPQLDMYIHEYKEFEIKQIPGVSIVPWRLDSIDEASQVIALSDLGETEIRRDLPEREPRQRWLGECKMLSGGEMNGDISHQAFKGVEMIGMIVGLIRESDLGRVEGIGVISLRDTQEIEKNLISLSLNGFLKNGINTARTTISSSKKRTIDSFRSLGFSEGVHKPNCLLLSSDHGWDTFCRESLAVTLEN
ncbi:MAG TPA: hypothetical protein PKV16_01450 [Caldisericia bacterium]|nr:hypothetical protein [Caldisericia bacterium]HPF48924.1 hypothetical protein [Caldisericia bacterium]HPI83212.1 hypothetical protein [Caldisericia bacterium]HPQ92439.1 hypothetical protein [Caldisericia bacterium]HRV74463.1 hypothetical protein [Caldisericia bacterium]